MKGLRFLLAAAVMMMVSATGRVAAQGGGRLQVTVATSSVYAEWSMPSPTYYYDINLYDNAGALVYSSTVGDSCVLIGGLNENTLYRLTVGEWVNGVLLRGDTAVFRTLSLGCAMYDVASDTLAVGTQGTTYSVSSTPIVQGAPYSYAMWLVQPTDMASVPDGALLTGIEFYYNYIHPMTHATNCSIYLGYTNHTTVYSYYDSVGGSGYQSDFEPIDSLTLVYEGPLNGVAQGWNHWMFNRGSIRYDSTRTLVVAVANNSGESDGVAYGCETHGWNHETASNQVLYVYGNNPYTEAVLRRLRRGANLIWNSYASVYRPCMRFTSGRCLQPLTCVPPQVVVAQVTNSSAEIAWARGWQETAWNVEYRHVDSTRWQLDWNGINDTNCTIAGLLPSSQYLVRVTPLCGDTTVSSLIRFTTTCEITALPFREGFEAWPVGNTVVMPPCWYSAGQYTNLPHTGDYYRHSGNNAIQFEQRSGGWSYLALPMLVMTVQGQTLSFWMLNTSQAERVLYVGVMDNPDSVATFVTVDSVVQRNSNTWEYFEADFANYTGTGHHIAIMARNASNVSGSAMLYVDDLELRLSTACHRVAALRCDSITDSEAVLRWTDTAGTGTYIVNHGPQGYAMGTDSAVTVQGNTTYTLRGLAASSSYDVYVRRLCGRDTSAIAYINLHTPCGEISRRALPWRHGFDDALQGANSILNQCCTKHTNSTRNPNYPSASTRSYSGSYSLNFISDATSWACMALPAVERGCSVAGLMVRFQLYSMGSYTGFEVGVMTDPDDYTTFTTISSITPSAGYSWQLFSVDLSGYSDTGRYIAFRAPAGASRNFYLDDIEVDVRPECSSISSVVASNILSTSALISWRLLSSTMQPPTSYEIEVEAAGTGNRRTASSNTQWLLLGGLNPGTQYTVLVRGICSGRAYTEWDTVRFVTSCLGGGDAIPSGREYNDQSGAPISSSYDNTFSQTIFTADELHSYGLRSGDISGCKITWTAASTNGKQLSIFLTTTSAASFQGTTASSWQPIGVNDMVYNHQLPLGTNGEATYQFDYNFHWDGTSNVVMTIVMNQIGNGQSSTGFNAYSTYTRPNVTLYAPRDSRAWSLQSAPTESGYTRDYRVNVTFITPCDNSVSCMPPNIHVDDAGANDVTLRWVPGYRETSWDIDYRLQGSAVWTVAAVGITAQSFRLTGLQPDNYYEVRVTPSCSPSHDSLASAVLVHTQCAAAALPFSEDFEAWNAAYTNIATPPACWVTLGTQNTRLCADDRSRSGSKSFMLNSGIGKNRALVLPVMDAPIDSLELSLWAQKSTTDANVFKVGVMEDVSDISSFVQVGPDLQCSTFGVWEPFTVSFASYRGAGRHIAILSPNVLNSNNYIDDISVARAVSCPTPDNLRLTDTTANTVTIAWDGHGASRYIVEYGPDGFAQGQGTTLIATVERVTLTGLTAGSTYNVYVQAVCRGGDSSNISLVLTFSTVCGDISQLPYSYGFEDATSDGQMGLIDHCWTKGTNHSIQYPYPTTNARHSGQYSLCAYVSNYYYSYVAMPTFRANINNLRLRYWCRRESVSNYGYVLVGVMNNPGDITTFTAVDTCVLLSNTSWQEFTVYLRGYTGSGRHIAIMPKSNSSINFDIDDITVDSVGTCVPPNQLSANADSITLTTAYIGWQDNAGATQWLVEYGPTGFALGSGTTVSTTSNPFTLTNLLPSTYYEYVVRSVCSASDTSQYSSTRGSFNTACGPVAHWQMPYSCGFEDCNSGSGQFSRCWDLGSSTSSYPRGYTSNQRSGSYCCYMYPGGTQNYMYAVLPEFADDISNLKLTVWGRRMSAGSSNTGYLVAGIITDHADINTFTPYDTMNFRSTFYMKDSVIFDRYRGASGRICLLAAGSNNLFIDDVVVGPSSNGCAMPTVAVTASDYQATLSWSEQGIRCEAAVKLVTDATWPAAVETTSDSMVFNNLTLGTMYDWRVRRVCGENYYSSWADGRFATLDTPQPCPEPTGLEASNSAETSVTLRWTTPSTVNYWEVEYGPEGFRPGDSTGLSTNVATNPAIISGLEPGTSYWFYVRSICNAGVYSNWSDHAAATTRSPQVIETVSLQGLTLHIYPNPASKTGLLTIELAGPEAERGQEIGVTLFDMVGREVGRHKLTVGRDRMGTAALQGGGKAGIPLQGLATGSYILRIETPHGTATQKIVVE
ncbi:MAG: fibronectin type III domain-containing protein [Bacteroidales bacterium]|nr:fibronectin type III domain-containing protein [Bacteroidales bacterium]